jgi:hypothetical protein
VTEKRWDCDRDRIIWQKSRYRLPSLTQKIASMRHNGEKIILAPFLIAEKTDKLLALARISPVYRQLMFHKGTKILFYVPLWNNFDGIFFCARSARITTSPGYPYRQATSPTLRSINNEKTD